MPALSEGVKVFVNPTSGGGRALASLAAVRGIFEGQKVAAKFVSTNSAEELERAAREAVAGGCGTLIAMGGDGTLQALVNAAFGADVVLGILPCGGGNDFAAALGLPADPMKAAQAVLQGEERAVDLLRATTGEGHSRFYVGGGGVGLDAEAARYASGKYKRLPGRTRYIASALRALAGYKAFAIRLEFPGGEWEAVETQSVLTAVLNSPSYGAGLRLAPEATIEDGLLHVVVIEDLSAAEIAKLLPRLAVKGELKSKGVRKFKATRVRIASAEPRTFHGDGEILGSTPVEIEVVPKAVRVWASSRGGRNRG